MCRDRSPPLFVPHLLQDLAQRPGTGGRRRWRQKVLQASSASAYMTGRLQPVQHRRGLFGRYQVRHQLSPVRHRNTFPGLRHGDVPRGMLAQLANADLLSLVHAVMVAPQVLLTERFQCPRTIHSSRCGASEPMEVGSPWPVRTAVSPGSVSSRVRIESMIVSNDENDRPVAPGPPWNRVSPVKTVLSSGTYRHDDPGECPGVVITCRSIPPAVSTSPSHRSWSGLRSGCAIVHSGASAGCR